MESFWPQLEVLVLGKSYQSSTEYEEEKDCKQGLYLHLNYHYLLFSLTSAL